jgi:tetratricopeptide (TPR) repeat protein
MIFGALLLVSGTPGAQARGNPQLAKGKRLLERAEDDKALKAFKRALKWRKNRRSDKVTIHLYLGITYFNLIRKKQARVSFRRALKLNPKAQLPVDVSPKIQELWSEVSAELKPPKPTPDPGRGAGQGGEGDPEGQGGEGDPEGQGDENRPPPVSPSTSMGEMRSSGKSFWPAWTLLGVGLAAGGTGVALGLLAKDRAADANDLHVPHDEAQARHDSASNMALTANILFGVAGAAAIASGILFYVFATRSETPPAVSVAPLDGGAFVQVRGLQW